ncbi:MAG: glycoside hydrolase [Acidobacteria bacterium]|nr:MAG: glycoside hydrolase [Acidobacteriota bacterium]
MSRRPPRWHFVFLVIALNLSSQVRVQAQSPADLIADLRRSFKKPPDDCRIMMRWWWFGPSVTQAELERELRTMKAGGIGGVEVQTTYPLELDNSLTGFRNYSFLSEEHLDALRFASEKAHELGLRFDLTLGSGWPYGGPTVPVTLAAGRLRVLVVSVPEGAGSVTVPDMEGGDQFIAAFLVGTVQGKIVTENVERLSDPRDGRILLPHFEGPHAVLFFTASRTGQQVKRPAIGAEGFVLDHYDRAAIQNYLHAVGDRLMQAFGSHPPYAIFSDSLEVYGSNWTSDFLKEFQARRGYDLMPYLPTLIGEPGSATREIRHDWGRTLTELANENYLMPLRNWASQHGTRFRSQNYGTPPLTLSSNALVDLPEGEGWQWKGFSAVRWAASANHLYGRPITSSETWTWLHSPVFRATPLDMKAAADSYFLEGSNQLIGHGWPYSPESAAEPGWRFYAAAVFNQHNPWWLVMPDVARYLQRTSYLLRQGKAAVDVALLLPTDDAWARFTATIDGTASATAGPFPPGASISVNEVEAALLGKRVIQQILEAGFNVDFIDAEAIDKIGIPYPVLVLPNLEHLPLTTYRKIEGYARNGGAVIAIGNLPLRAPGLKQSESDSSLVLQISQELFREPGAPGHFLADEADLGQTLARVMKQDVSLSPPAPDIGFVHRKLPFADIYFLANTANQRVRTQGAFRVSADQAELWDPVSGATRTLSAASAVQLSFEPYQSCILVFYHQGLVSKRTQISAAKPNAPLSALDLASNWSVTFSGLGRTVKMKTLHSWTDDADTKYYSGTAVYEKELKVPVALLKPDINLYLDFGPGTPIPVTTVASDLGADATGSGTPRMQAWLDSPVREGALIFVDNRLVGAVWLPPYQVDVTQYLHAGDNQLKIVVGNLAINEKLRHSADSPSPLIQCQTREKQPRLKLIQSAKHLQPTPFLWRPRLEPNHPSYAKPNPLNLSS